jgi:hypothetical protein
MTRTRWTLTWRLLPVLAALALAFGLSVPAAGASVRAATAKTHISFSFTGDRVSDTARPHLKWSVTGHLPAGRAIELQRQYGTAHVWKNVEGLHARVGTGYAPRVELGKYKYRIVVSKGRRTLAISADQVLYSYGDIPLANICGDANNGDQGVQVAGSGGSCGTSTVQVGGTVFTYLLFDGNGTEPPNYDQSVIFPPRTSCRAITLQWALDNGAGSSDTASVEIVQASADPQSASTPYGQVGQQTFSLTGSAWDLDNWVTGPDNEYINGSLSCYTTSGLR